jgi:hypothetical protein
MNNLMKKACVSLMALMLVSLNASAEGNSTKSNKTSSFDWNPVMDAIIQVESGGNPKAVSGNSVGAMQITPILVKQCNIYLQQQKSKKRYTLADRYSVAKSKEMFLLIQSVLNPQNSVEKAIRMWNGGPNYSVRATNRYYQKVMNKMK